MNKSTPIDQAGRLLSRRQVAERLSVSTKTVQRMERAGVLPAVRLGEKTVRYRLSTVDALVASRTQWQGVA